MVTCAIALYFGPFRSRRNITPLRRSYVLASSISPFLRILCGSAVLTMHCLPKWSHLLLWPWMPSLWWQLHSISSQDLTSCSMDIANLVCQKPNSQSFYVPKETSPQWPSSTSGPQPSQVLQVFMTRTQGHSWSFSFTSFYLYFSHTGLNHHCLSSGFHLINLPNPLLAFFSSLFFIQIIWKCKFYWHFPTWNPPLASYCT